jgi:hypothetical protein
MQRFKCRGNGVDWKDRGRLCRSAASRASPESDLGFDPNGAFRATKLRAGTFRLSRNDYMPQATKIMTGQETRMRWVIALFVALLMIPIAQVAADAWNGRPGPLLSVMPFGSRPGLAVTRIHHYRLYDPLAPWLPGRARTG